MELNQTYCINIVSRSNNKRYYGYSFVVVEKFNSNSSQHFQNYYRRLLTFNRCGEWFQNLDCPHVEVGKIVIVRIDRKMNLWARGIISKCESHILFPEVYLIDSQRFFDNDKIEFRICPTKFAQLILPTYNICLNLCSDDDDLHYKTAIDMLISKNQYGELHFYFTPKSIENDIYYGELTVNNQNDNLTVPLKKLLKNIHKKKNFQEISKYRQRNISFFDPLNFKYLQNIFKPRDPNSMIFFDKNLIASYSDLNGIDNSLELSLYDSSDDHSSTIDYSESSNPSNDSVLEVQKQQIDCTNPIAEQKTYSSFFSSSLLDCSSELNSVIDRLYNSIIRGNQESIVLETTADHVDENKLNDAITMDIDAITMSTCFKTENTNSYLSEKKPGGTVDQKIGDFSEEKQFTNIDMLMKQQFDCLPNLSTLKNTQCKSNNNFDNFTAVEKEILSNRSIIEIKVEPIKTSMDDSHVWWSSDDES